MTKRDGLEVQPGAESVVADQPQLMCPTCRKNEGKTVPLVYLGQRTHESYIGQQYQCKVCKTLLMHPVDVMSAAHEAERQAVRMHDKPARKWVHYGSRPVSPPDRPEIAVTTPTPD